MVRFLSKKEREALKVEKETQGNKTSIRTTEEGVERVNHAH
jgi:hypothetical protein